MPRSTRTGITQTAAAVGAYFVGKTGTGPSSIDTSVPSGTALLGGHGVNPATYASVILIPEITNAFVDTVEGNVRSVIKSAVMTKGWTRRAKSSQPLDRAPGTPSTYFAAAVDDFRADPSSLVGMNR